MVNENEIIKNIVKLIGNFENRLKALEDDSKLLDDPGSDERYVIFFDKNESSSLKNTGPIPIQPQPLESPQWLIYSQTEFKALINSGDLPRKGTQYYLSYGYQGEEDGENNPSDLVEGSWYINAIQTKNSDVLALINKEEKNNNAPRPIGPNGQKFRSYLFTRNNGQLLGKFSYPKDDSPTNRPIPLPLDANTLHNDFLSFTPSNLAWATNIGLPSDQTEEGWYINYDFVESPMSSGGSNINLQLVSKVDSIIYARLQPSVGSQLLTLRPTIRSNSPATKPKAPPPDSFTLFKNAYIYARPRTLGPGQGGEQKEWFYTTSQVPPPNFPILYAASAGKGKFTLNTINNILTQNKFSSKLNPLCCTDNSNILINYISQLYVNKNILTSSNLNPTTIKPPLSRTTIKNDSFTLITKQVQGKENQKVIYIILRLNSIDVKDSEKANQYYLGYVSGENNMLELVWIPYPQ